MGSDPIWDIVHLGNLYIHVPERMLKISVPVYDYCILFVETPVMFIFYSTNCGQHQQPASCNMFPTNCSFPSKLPLIFGLIVAAVLVLLMCCLAEAEPVLSASSCQYPGQGVYMLHYSDFSRSSPGSKIVFFFSLKIKKERNLDTAQKNT